MTLWEPAHKLWVGIRPLVCHLRSLTRSCVSHDALLCKPVSPTIVWGLTLPTYKSNTLTSRKKKNKKTVNKRELRVTPDNLFIVLVEQPDGNSKTQNGAHI